MSGLTSNSGVTEVSGLVASGGAADAGGSDFLDGVLDSTCFDLDATIVDSYGGSGQTWANLITSPADGASQTDYDFHLGNDATADTTDPTFTGSAGDQAAYFSLDGGDCFNIKSFTSAQSVLFNAAKSNSSWWIAITALIPTSVNNDNLCGSGDLAADIGIKFNCTSATLNRCNLFQQDGSTNRNIGFVGNSINRDGNNIIIISNNGGTPIQWHNSTTGVNGNGAYSTNTTDPARSFRIGSTSDAAGIEDAMPSGTRIYSFAGGNEFLDDTKAAAIISHLETRHNRDYTP